MRLLGIDPSLRNTGWAVIDCTDDGEFLVAAGCISTEKSKQSVHATKCEDDMARIDKIAMGLLRVVRDHDVLMSSIEGRAGAMSARSAEAMSMAFACVMTTLRLAGVSRMIISPHKAKSITANHIKGKTKQAVKDEVRYRLGATKWDESLIGLRKGAHEHCYDAAAVALASLSHPALLYIRRKEMMESGSDQEAIGIRSIDGLGELHGPGRCG